MKEYEPFQRVLDAFSLGTPTALPKLLTGGLMHRMYRVETSSGIWALKCLNPDVMRRPEAVGNLQAAERIAQKLSAIVPASTAVLVHGHPLTVLSGQYYMLFKWCRGEPIFPPDLTPGHCGMIGHILGRIHTAGLTLPDIPAAEKPAAIDWNALGKASGHIVLPWAVQFAAMLPQCMQWHDAARQAYAALNATCVLSHRDLDPKNVLWEDNVPCLIDWEAAGPVNPNLEIFTALRGWSDNGAGGILEAQFQAMLSAYCAERSVNGVPWKDIASAAMTGVLEWLAYNVRRACEDTADIAERKLGAAQVTATLNTLRTYETTTTQMLNLLYHFAN